LKSKEILNQEFEDINRMMLKVTYPCKRHCDTGLIFPFPKKDKEQNGKIEADKNYKHITFTTRPYRHETSAVYKLIRSIRHELKNAHKVYWRLKPEIFIRNDFDLRCKMFIGRVRFSKI